MDNYYIKGVRLDGEETTYELFFTEVREETGEEFAYYIEMDAQEPGVLVYKRALDGSLIDIESEDDWNWASAMFEKHQAKLQEMDCESCQMN